MSKLEEAQEQAVMSCFCNFIAELAESVARKCAQFEKVPVPDGTLAPLNALLNPHNQAPESERGTHIHSGQGENLATKLAIQVPGGVLNTRANQMMSLQPSVSTHLGLPGWSHTLPEASNSPSTTSLLPSNLPQSIGPDSSLLGPSSDFQQVSLECNIR